jgi:hypothetical protein
MEIKPIPGTLGFLASSSGKIYGPTGQRRQTYLNGDGYETASVLLDSGKYQTFGVHRLVALAHIPIPEGKSADQLTVNHVDKDISNNEAYNLEWVSAYLNNLHASLMDRTSDRPRLVLTEPSGNRLLAKNLYEASEAAGVDIGLAWEMVKEGLQINGYSLKPCNRRTGIPADLHKPKIIERDAKGRQVQSGVKVKDLETGTIEEFVSLNDAARRHEVSASHIYQCLSTISETRLFKKRFLIVREGEAFPNVTPEQLDELRSPGGKETICVSKVTGSTSIYPSASLMIKHLGLSKKAVSVRLRRDGYGEVGDWKFAYVKNRNAILTSDQSSSSPSSFVS